MDTDKLLGKEDAEELEEMVQQTESTSGQQFSKARQVGMLVTILVLMFSTLSTETMIFPFFPTIAANKGISTTAMAFVFSSYDFSRFVASPIFGSLLTKWPPKSMCAVGNIVTASTCIAFGIADLAEEEHVFLALCVLIRIVAGVGSAMLTVSGTSILMKSTSYEPSTIAGSIEVMIGFGYATGPAIGAGLYELVGYTPMFCIFGGLMLGFLPVYAVIVPKVADNHIDNKGGFISLLVIPGCLLMFCTCIILKINGSTRSTEISEYITSTFHVSPSVVGLIFGLWAVAYIVCSFVTTKLINRKYMFQMMITGLCLFTIVILMVGPSQVLGFIFHGNKYLWLTAAAITIDHALLPLVYIPPYQTTLDLTEVNGYKRDSLHTYGMVAGLINSGLALGNTIGPIIGGPITDALGYPWTVECLAGVNIILILLMTTYVIYMKCTKQPLYVTTEVSTTEGNLTDCNISEDENVQTVEEKINAACVDRMNKCLNNSKPLTQAYQQQPLIE